VLWGKLHLGHQGAEKRRTQPPWALHAFHYTHRGGTMNFQKLLKEAQKAQKKAAEVQERLERMTVVGSAQGLVEVEANGHGKILALRLKPEALKAFQDDPEGLEDLLLVAIQDAQTKAHELSEKEMAKELGGVGQMLGKLF